MLSPVFATKVIGVAPTVVDTSIPISSDPVKVIGFTADRLGSATNMTVTVTSFDGTVTYDVIKFSPINATATHYVSNHPWVADKGIAFICSNVNCFVAFYIQQIGG